LLEFWAYMSISFQIYIYIYKVVTDS